MRLFSHSIFAFFITMVAASSASAQGVQSLCADMDRPNIDCSCVAQRMETFTSVANAKEKDLLMEGYKFSIGADNSYAELSELSPNARAEDFMWMMDAEEKFAPMGGLPDEISEYEQGCVIAGAPAKQFKPYKDGSVEQEYIEKKLGVVGQSYRNETICEVREYRKFLSREELQAYSLSFGEYDGDQLEDWQIARAKKMGLSVNKYERLRRTAQTKIEADQDRISNYCAAMIWGNDADGFTAEERKLAGFEPGQTAPRELKSSELSSNAGPLAKSKDIVARNCEGRGMGEVHCQCVADQFDSKIVKRSKSPDVTLAWASLMASDSLPPSESQNLMMSADPAAMQTAVMMQIGYDDLEMACQSAGASEKPRMEGAAASRMTKICMAENDDETLCKCMTEQMQSKLGPDDFELIVDIREAEYRGEADPLETVAKERGLTREEAEEAMMMNNSMMSGMMGMDLMACMGGIPNMPGGMGGFPMPGQQ